MTRDDVQDIAGDDVPLLFLDGDGMDDALLGLMVGFGATCAALYSMRRVLEAFVAQGMTWEEAQEYFGYNTIGAYVGDHTPVYLHDLSPAHGHPDPPAPARPSRARQKPALAAPAIALRRARAARRLR